MYNNLTLDNISTFYENLCREEEQVNEEINDLLKQENELEAALKTLQKQMPNLQLIESDAKQLSSMIGFTSTLAENVSSKVRRLDLAKSRVTSVQQRVNDILDLKFCTDGIHKALLEEDYEQAAAHIHRFLSIDESDLKKSAEATGSEMTPSGDELSASSMLEAFAQLHEAEAKLKALVMRRFDEAVSHDDVASVERFFKIFPLLNQHEEGLKKFSRYLCTKINDKSLIENVPATNITHADQLTHLYESIAKLIDIHQPLIETYYGPGQLISVIEVLQKDCDRQSKRILDDFKAKKNMSSTASAVLKALKGVSSYNSTNKIDPKEIDQLLTEITLLNARSEMYLRFINKRMRNDIEVAIPSGSENQEARQKILDRMEVFMRQCELSQHMHEINGTYVLMEEYFMIESACKAILLDAVESGALTSSLLDDVFFILKKCIKRAFSSGSVDVVCAMINHSVSFLESNYCDTLNDRLKHGYPSTISGAAAAWDLSQAYSAIQTGRYLQSSSDVEKARALFITALNNLDVSCEYVKSLKANLNDDIKKTFQSHQLQQEKEKQKLESCFSDMVALTGKFKSIVTSGLGQLCSAILKPRIKTWIEEFLDSNHKLNEDDVNVYEASDGLRPFTQTFLLSIDALFKSFKDTLTQNNYDALLSLFSTELTHRLETAIFKIKCNKVCFYIMQAII